MEVRSVQSLMLRRPVVLKNNNTLRDAARAMQHNEVGCVLISDLHGVLTGIMTDRDLAIALGSERVRTSNRLSQATEMPLIYVSENSTTAEVIAVMKQFAIRRVPVVRIQKNGRQRCLGMITLDDLVRGGHISIEEESEILNSQLKAPKDVVSRSRVKSIFHNQDQREASLYLFLKKIESGTGLDAVSAKSLTVHVLSVLFRGLSSKSSKNLLSQLPYELQVQLMSEVGGVDRTITAKSFLKQFQKRYKMDDEGALELLHNFWASLGEALSVGEIEKIHRQLPRDMASLFNKPLV